MTVAVIIAAAGASQRYSAAARAQLGVEGQRSKLDEDLGGRPVLQRTIELFNQRPEVSTIIVAGPAEPAAMEDFKLRYADKLAMLGCRLCAGGREYRWQTVKNALALVPESCTHVAVHDGARPCTPTEVIDRVFAAAERHAAVIPAIDVPDTLKRMSSQTISDDKPDPLAAILGTDAPSARAPGLRVVAETVDRSSLVAVQTPQVFAREVLIRAYQQADLSGTDDAQLVERLAKKEGASSGVASGVVIVPGDARNIKITLPNDMVLARAIMGLRPQGEKPAHLRF